MVTGHPSMAFLLLHAVLPALYPALTKARGRGGGWWSPRKRDKLTLIQGQRKQCLILVPARLLPALMQRREENKSAAAEVAAPKAGLH